MELKLSMLEQKELWLSHKCLYLRNTNPFSQIQEQPRNSNSACWKTLHKLIFNWKFQLLEYWRPLEALGKRLWNYNTSVNGFQKFLCLVDGHEKTNFLLQQRFWLRLLFDLLFLIWWIKKWPEPKKLLNQKITFFMPVNHQKEFLKSIHTGVVFWGRYSTASIGPHYSRSWNFQLKISLCSVFQSAEFNF